MARSSIKILLIEDNSDDVRLIQDIVKESSNDPMELIRAESLTEGKRIIAMGNIDAVLLDLILPDSEMCATVRQAAQMASAVPIIIMAGLEDEALANRIIFNGVQDYLIKGQFNSCILRRSVRYAIERKRAAMEKDKLLAELCEALAHVKTLRGLLPVCSYCKKVRNDKGYREQIEVYVTKYLHAEFSHGICPECMAKVETQGCSLNVAVPTDK